MLIALHNEPRKPKNAIAFMQARPPPSPITSAPRCSCRFCHATTNVRSQVAGARRSRLTWHHAHVRSASGAGSTKKARSSCPSWSRRHPTPVIVPVGVRARRHAGRGGGQRATLTATATGQSLCDSAKSRCETRIWAPSLVSQTRCTLFWVPLILRVRVSLFEFCPPRRQEEFRRYLERSGTFDVLERLLVGLLDAPPDSPEVRCLLSPTAPFFKCNWSQRWAQGVYPRPSALKLGRTRRRRADAGTPGTRAALHPGWWG